MLRHSETCNSIYPVTFPNIHRKSHFPKKKHCRSSSIADKRQRNACIGDCIGHHCNIQNNLKSQMPHIPSTDKSSGQIFCMHGSHTQPPQKHCKQKNQKDSSGCSHFLTYNRKNHIILRFRNKSKFLQTVSKSSAEYSAAADGIQSLDRLKSFFILHRISPDCKTFQTITLCSKKNSYETCTCAAKPDKFQISRIGYKNQDSTDTQNNDRCTQII